MRAGGGGGGQDHQLFFSVNDKEFLCVAHFQDPRWDNKEFCYINHKRGDRWLPYMMSSNGYEYIFTHEAGYKTLYQAEKNGYQIVNAMAAISYMNKKNNTSLYHGGDGRQSAACVWVTLRTFLPSLPNCFPYLQKLKETDKCIKRIQQLMFDELHDNQ